MYELDVTSNAQSWELEVVCKNKQYLEAVVKSILLYGMIDFQVTSETCESNENGWNGRYTVLMSGHWFKTLASISADLAGIEKQLDNI